jgi:thiopeptide-type bacteriocin biosynthesis protein
MPAIPAVSNLKLGPGPDWLFAKLYCGESHADRLLLELVKPLVEELQSAGRVDGWFFIRYADPHWHVRLRFHADPDVLTTYVLPQLRERAEHQIALGTLWRLKFDTYEPETERYGGPAAMGIVERFFQLDSEMCLQLTNQISKAHDASLRWRLAFHGVDRLLSGLGFTLEEKRAMAKDMAESQERSYIVDEGYKKQVAARFRQERKTLSALCDDSAVAGVLPELALSAFHSYSTGLEGIRQELDELARTESLTLSKRDIAVSLVHMSLNRLLLTGHHAQETVLYNFLARAYAARLAI